MAEKTGGTSAKYMVSIFSNTCSLPCQWKAQAETRKQGVQFQSHLTLNWLEVGVLSRPVNQS